MSAYWPAGVKYRPLGAWPGARTEKPRRSPFRVGVGVTEAELSTEIRLGPLRNVVLQIALTEADLRVDGTPRARANPSDAGVILSFDRADGSSLSMPCDAFMTWEENLLAIVRTINMLRAVDRYGVTTRGEQYAGWRALEARAMPAAFQSAADAEEFLRDWCGSDWEDRPLRAVIREAKRTTHPDMSGDAATFDRVMQAERFLRDTGAI